jgi:hypothetical protein
MAAELKSLRKKLFPERLPPLKPKLSPRGVLHQSQVVGTHQADVITVFVCF